MPGLLWINNSGQQLTWFVATGDGQDQTGPLDSSHRMPTPPKAASAGIVGPAPAGCRIGAYTNPGEFGYDCVFFVIEESQDNAADLHSQVTEPSPQ